MHRIRPAFGRQALESLRQAVSHGVAREQAFNAFVLEGERNAGAIGNRIVRLVGFSAAEDVGMPPGGT